MKIDLRNLTSDTHLLHQMILGLTKELVSLEDQNQSLKEKNQSLKEQLALLKAKLFGRSSEKSNGESNGPLESDIEELEFRIEENESVDCPEGDGEEEVDGEEDIETDPPRKKGKAKRKAWPDHLERNDITIPPVTTCPSCGGEAFRKMSDDTSEMLDRVSVSFKVNRYIRPRCACIACETIVQAEMPSKPIPKGKAEPGLLAHIIVQKYCNHLPLYRQAQMFEREGIDLSRSTMASWVGQCSSLLEPLLQEIRKAVFASSEIHGDDTTVKVLAPGLGKTTTGRIWTYLRDPRPHGDTTTPPAVCYFYSPDRKAERPMEHLKGFTGILHADAYAGYNHLYTSEENPTATITEAACWAHARRKFHDVIMVNEKANIASAILEHIGKIYAIEEDIRGRIPEDRLVERQKRSKALVETLFARFKKHLNELPKKSSTTKAIVYAMNNQAALMRFLDNGSIEIDNNAAERAMRGVAIGRKNWLFAGSDSGGEATAAMATIIETAKLNNINPWLYLREVLTQIQDHNSQKIEELLPWNMTRNKQ